MAYVGKQPQPKFLGQVDDLTVAGDANIDTNTLVVDSTNNRVGIGTSTPSNGNLNIVDDNPSIRFDDTSTTNNGEITVDNTSIRIEADPSNSTADSNISLQVDGSEKMRIDSSGAVLVNNLSALESEKLRVTGTNGSLALDPGDFFSHSVAIFENDGECTVTIASDSASSGLLRFTDVDGNSGEIEYDHASDYMAFATNAAEAMRIDDDGVVMVGATSAVTNVQAFQAGTPDVAGTGSGATGTIMFSNGTTWGSTTSTIQAYYNDASTSAGTHNYLLWRFQGSTIGDVDTLDNSTIRYNTFTGAHWTQFEDGTQPDLPLGTVLSTIDDLLQWTEYEYTNEDGQTEKTTAAGFDTIGGTKTIYIDEDGATAEGTALSHDTAKRIAKCKVSDVEGDKCVYGVFAGHYKDGDSSVESLGLGVIRIGSGVTVQRGDLLESAGDGTARPQTGDTADLFKAGTIAKVTSTTVVETYDDGSYTVPCTLHCG